MTRDLAAVATLDDRRRCPISAASNVADDASSLITNSITTSGSSTNGDVGGGEEGDSPKSSSVVSTTTSCCGGSSSSSRSGSDDDDSIAVSRLTTVIGDKCPTNMKISQLPSPHNDIITINNGDKDSSSSSNSNDAEKASASTTIGGRLTFYKDGKFILQLAAHHQERSHNSITTPCRWVPVSTEIQQDKSNVKCISEQSSHQRNKTVWPYLVTNQHASDCKSPQPMQQTQTAKAIERKPQLQQSQRRTATPPSFTTIAGPVIIPKFTSSVVVATTTNITRRPSRKYSTTTSGENFTDLHQQNRQPQSLQLRNLLRHPQQHQHHSFMMVANKVIKAQRRLLSLPRKQHRRHRQRLTSTAIGRESLQFSESQQIPLVNLEHVVRHLWCRRHTTELLRKQLSINNADGAADAMSLVSSRHTAIDAACSNIIVGGGKRRSFLTPLSSTSVVTTTNVSTAPTTSTSSVNSDKEGSSGSSPHKKYKLGQQRHSANENSVRNITSPSLGSTNDHSITAILSSGATATKRVSVLASMADSENCVINSRVTTTTSAVVTQQKNMSSAPLSLLRTLLKSPSNEISTQPPTVSSNSSVYTKLHHVNSGNINRKRSAIGSTTAISPLVSRAEENIVGSRSTMSASLPSTSNTVNDAITTAALTALSQLPTLHNPVAAGQLAAAGYFNVLYHQAAIAAAMAYQNHGQLPQSLSKPPPLITPQFPTTSSTNNSWQRQQNRRSSMLLNPRLELTSGNEKTSTADINISSSGATIVAPYSSPLMASVINSSGMLPPVTPSTPPPSPLLLNSVHPRRVLLHQMQQPHQLQQYQPTPTVQQLSSYHAPKQQYQSSAVKKKTPVLKRAERNNTVVDEESSSSADCMPLNLSKDSVADTVDSATAAVR